MLGRPEGLHEAAAEHAEPGFEAALAILQGRWPIEEVAEGDFQAAALKDGGIFGDAWVIPGIEALWIFDAEAAERLVRGLHEDLDVAVATELAHQTATGFQGAGHGGGSSLGRLDPVQHGVGEDGVELGVEGQLADVTGLEGEAGEVLACLGDHGVGRVGTEHLSAGAGDLGGEMAGAAADIEDALAGLGGKESEKVAPEFPDESVRGIVESGIPIGGHPTIVIGPKRDKFVPPFLVGLAETRGLVAGEPK